MFESFTYQKVKNKDTSSILFTIWRTSKSVKMKKREWQRESSKWKNLNLFTCSGVFLWGSAISATTESFNMGPCADLDLLNDIRGVPDSSSPDPLSDRVRLVVGTPKGV